MVIGEDISVFLSWYKLWITNVRCDIFTSVRKYLEYCSEDLTEENMETNKNAHFRTLNKGGKA